MSPIETLFVLIRNLSSGGHFEKLRNHLVSNNELLLKRDYLDEALTKLDLQKHSLGVLNILVAKCQNTPEPNDALLNVIEEFISVCNGEQIRFASDTFAELCHRYTTMLLKKNTPLQGVHILYKAIIKVQLHDDQLTSIHSDFCKLCLLSKCLKPALSFLESDITEISKDHGKFDVEYFLLYYYYGGMIYAALKRFERALYFFEVTLTTPCMTISAIMIEAYRKYVIIALILSGKVPPLPKYTSHVISRFVKCKTCEAYNELETAYLTNNPQEVSNVINKYSVTFVRHNNMGLVKQCLTSLYKKNIQRLTKTFITLSLSDMANRVQLSSPQEAEEYILRMMEEGEIFASINQENGMVSFLDNPEKYNTSAIFRRLEDEMKACIQLDENLKRMNHEIALNPKYIQKAKVEAE